MMHRTGVAGRPATRRHFVAGLSSTVLGGASFAGARPARSQSPGSVTLGWVKSTTNLAASISPEYATKHGLRVESANFNTAVDISTAMVSGDVHIGLLTPIHLLRAIETKLDFVQICGNSRVDSTIVAAKKLALGMQNWPALKELASQRKLRIASSRGSIN